MTFLQTFRKRLALSMVFFMIMGSFLATTSTEVTASVQETYVEKIYPQINDFVDIDTDILFTFKEEIQLTNNGGVYIKKYNSGGYEQKVLQNDIIIAGNVVRIDHSNFEYNSCYLIEIKAGTFKGKENGVAQSNGYLISFYTIPDKSQPFGLIVKGENGVNKVSIGSTLKMNATTSGSGIVVPPHVEWSIHEGGEFASVVDISREGIVTGITEGIAVIQAKVTMAGQEYIGRCSVDVTPITITSHEPYIVSSYPEINDFVDVDTDIFFTFKEDVALTSGSGLYIEKYNSMGYRQNVAEQDIYIENNVVKISHNAFDYNGCYIVGINPGTFKGKENGVVQSNGYLISFYTIPDPSQQDSLIIKGQNGIKKVSVGSTLKLTTMTLGSGNVTPPNVEWSIYEGDGVASIDKSTDWNDQAGTGIVTGIREGTAIIQAKVIMKGHEYTGRIPISVVTETVTANEPYIERTYPQINDFVDINTEILLTFKDDIEITDRGGISIQKYKSGNSLQMIPIENIYIAGNIARISHDDFDYNSSYIIEIKPETFRGKANGVISKYGSIISFYTIPNPNESLGLIVQGQNGVNRVTTGNILKVTATTAGSDNVILPNVEWSILEGQEFASIAASTSLEDQKGTGVVFGKKEGTAVIQAKVTIEGHEYIGKQSITIVKDNSTSSSGGSSSSNSSYNSNPNVTGNNIAALTIDGNKVIINTASIDTTKDAYEINSTDGKVTLPLSVLNEIKDKKEKFNFSVSTSLASYELPANIIDISTELNDIMKKNNVTAKDVAINIVIADKTNQAEIYLPINEHMQQGVLSNIVDFQINVSNIQTGKSFGTLSSFNQEIERTINIKETLSAMPKYWGAYRYNDIKKTVHFIPGVVSKNDGQLQVTIKSDSNSIYFVAENHVIFHDVESHWAKDYIETAASKLLLVGTGTGNFEPEKNVTRAEFATMIANSLQLSEHYKTQGYSDVTKGAWYYDPVMKLKEIGLLEDFSDTIFKPNDVMTREEMAIIVSHVLDYKGISSVQVKPDSILFEDIDLTNTVSTQAINTLVSNNIMIGVNASKFSPSTGVTRAQAAVVLTKLLKKIVYI